MDRLATGIMLVWHAMFGINSLIDPAEMINVILGTGIPSKAQVSTWHARQVVHGLVADAASCMCRHVGAAPRLPACHIVRETLPRSNVSKLSAVQRTFTALLIWPRLRSNEGGPVLSTVIVEHTVPLLGAHAPCDIGVFAVAPRVGRTTVLAFLGILSHRLHSVARIGLQQGGHDCAKHECSLPSVHCPHVPGHAWKQLVQKKKPS
jgi:hypothetical protein